MKFEPKTEAQVSSYQTYAPGVYDFEIVKATDETSKAGNDMIKVVLKIFGNDGTSSIISDYLLTNEEMAYKLRHCCSAIGIIKKYESGELEAGDFVTGVGKVKLKIDKGKEKDDKSGFYQDRNAVVDYIAGDDRSASEKEKSDKNHGLKRNKAKLDDSIPF